MALALKNAAEHQKIQALAITDELTGLYNRRAFQRVLDREFRRSRRYQKPLSLIMLDVDGFKAINDTYGHQAGDSVLKALANQLQGAIREIDFLARYGGDEFAVILPETKAEEAGMLAERLKQIISNRPIIIANDNRLFSFIARIVVASTCGLKFGEVGETADNSTIRVFRDRPATDSVNARVRHQ